jgi:hypothetical protein
VVPTHEKLKDKEEWDNELHPKDPGFLKIARKFRPCCNNISVPISDPPPLTNAVARWWIAR